VARIEMPTAATSARTSLDVTRFAGGGMGTSSEVGDRFLTMDMQWKARFIRNEWGRRALASTARVSADDISS
jgi:hypothetical protein